MNYLLFVAACAASALVVAQAGPVFSVIGREPDGQTREKPQPSGLPRTNMLRSEGALIRSFRQAAISTQVSGRIMVRRFEAGDHVAKGDVVFQLFPEDYQIARTRAEERLLRMRIDEEKWQSELNLLQDLIRHEAATRRQIMEADAERKIALRKAKEAEMGLMQAELNLQRCTVRAPFAGYITQVFREAFESVQQGDQLFIVADISKVYAVVNIRWESAQKISKGCEAHFIGPGGTKFPGTVDKIEKPIDPSSQTKRIHVLIANPGEALQMGMLGALEFQLKK